MRPRNATRKAVRTVKPEVDAPLLKKLGPGLITGAADDDPSGIATYSQGGAAFGTGLLWTLVFTFPLMVGIQNVSARLGRVTGRGLAGIMREHYPRPLLYAVVSMLLVANTINIAADIAAMGDALALLIGGSRYLYAIGFGVFSCALQIWLPYNRYVRILKWLTLSLFAYVAVVFVVDIPWAKVAHDALLPKISLDPQYVTVVVAIFGTTISPYLFFWQASLEVEDIHAVRADRPLKESPEQAKKQLHRIKIDTMFGMAVSNLIAFFIMLTTAVTLHGQGIADIQTSAQAAEALKPIAGEFAFLLFSFGIIGTGLLAIPVLAGSAAFAVAETFRWRRGLALKPKAGIRFYAIIAASTLIGIALGFTKIDPIRMLFWSAVINGVIAVPIMVVMMRMAVNSAVMGQFVITRRLRVLGWAATGVMGFAVAAMGWQFATGG